MVGGGQGGFIGAVHRIAARLDDRYILLAGALSSDPQRAQDSGLQLHLAADRIYTDYRTMAMRESTRPDGIEVVSVVTPNHLHFPVAQAFLQAGIHVICDKPLTTSLADALALQTLAGSSDRLFALTHNYSAYPMVRAARAMVADGRLGQLRLVQVEYAQDWLSEPLVGNKQADWRTDPALAGPAGCLADIGSHAAQLAQFVSGMAPLELSADLSSFVAGRRLDDHVQMQLRYANGARGMLWASQVASGEQNGLRLRVYGSQGMLDWRQEQPDQLCLRKPGGAASRLTRGMAQLPAAAQWATRLPAGHPEGYLESFAQLYRDFAEQICARREGRAADPQALLVPTLADGVSGMRFIEAALASHHANAAWVRLET